jgi:hypothetical protein
VLYSSSTSLIAVFVLLIPVILLLAIGAYLLAQKSTDLLTSYRAANNESKYIDTSDPTIFRRDGSNKIIYFVIYLCIKNNAISII